MVEHLLPKQVTRVRFPYPAPTNYATLAQLVEQCFRKAEVPGSIPGGGSITKNSAQGGVFCYGVSLRLHSNLLYQKFVMMANCTRGARGGSELNRTLGQSPRHRPADSAATPKEKTLLAFLIWREEFFLKKERVFFFRGFCPPSIRAVWRGEMQFGRGKAKLFLREKKDLLYLDSFCAGILYPPRRRVREECTADPFLIFFGGREGLYKRISHEFIVSVNIYF